MELRRRLVALLLATLVLPFGLGACNGDDAGEDTLGDGEVNDEGD